jgi:hypothetical protein
MRIILTRLNLSLAASIKYRTNYIGFFKPLVMPCGALQIADFQPTSSTGPTTNRFESSEPDSRLAKEESNAYSV